MIGPLLMLVALAAGVLAGERLGGGPARLLLGFALVGFAAAFTWRASRVGAVTAIVACALLGVAVEQRALHGLEASPLTAAVAREASGEAVLTLTEDPDGPLFESAAIARVDAFGGRSAGERSVFVGVHGDERSVFAALDAGDQLRASGTLAPLSGFSSRLRWRHAVGEFRVDDIRAVGRPSSPWYAAANLARRAVLRGSTTLPSTPRALLTGFLLGDTRAIPDDLVVAFRDAGLSHLLAVSGANVAFALAVVEPLLHRLRRGPRLVGGLGVLVLFGTMTRWEPS
ncbi:MAG: ComEC/Rec2 family competence protein, partial [Acidimicrobiia bacterium]